MYLKTKKFHQGTTFQDSKKRKVYGNVMSKTYKNGNAKQNF